MHLFRNYSLKPFNTFGIDAKANYFARFDSVEELRGLLQLPEVKASEKLILGGGSNVLFTKDFEGVVLQNGITGIEIVHEDETVALVKAGGGEVWHDLVLFALAQNLGGLENLSLIPGTVGASPLQNIGAYGVELKDVFHELEAVALETGELHTFSGDACGFGYRDSIFKREAKGRYIITSVTFKLHKHHTLNTSYGAIKDTLHQMQVVQPTIQDVSAAVCAIRQSKLPDPKVIGNAGSFFKNPEIPLLLFDTLRQQYPDMPSYPVSETTVKVPAGWLIEKCGWKGKIIGNYGVHKNQALVLVNYGGAQGQDLRQLAYDIIQSVQEKFGIALQPEVNII